MVKHEPELHSCSAWTVDKQIDKQVRPELGVTRVKLLLTRCSRGGPKWT
jgi:hypothetical protein